MQNRSKTRDLLNHHNKSIVRSCINFPLLTSEKERKFLRMAFRNLNNFERKKTTAQFCHVWHRFIISWKYVMKTGNWLQAEFRNWLGFSADFVDFSLVSVARPSVSVRESNPYFRPCVCRLLCYGSSSHFAWSLHADEESIYSNFICLS